MTPEEYNRKLQNIRKEIQIIKAERGRLDNRITTLLGILDRLEQDLDELESIYVAGI